jgi:flagella basal body P-ring formation protein FlgA
MVKKVRGQGLSSGVVAEGSGVRGQESKKAMTNERKIVMIFLLVFVLCLPSSIFHLPSDACYASEYSGTEAKIMHFIQDIYNNSDDIQIRLNTIPSQIKENTKVKNITFMKVPDASGDGICTVEIDTRSGRSVHVQVPFRVFVKKKLLVLKMAGKKDEAIRKGDIFIKETYMKGKGNEYPTSLEDLAGKVLKKDVPANTIIAYQMLEESVAVQRGEVVNIVAENTKLLVLTKGKTIDKGRVGDTVRVKNISSGKEIVGRVTAHNTVAIDL